MRWNPCLALLRWPRTQYQIGQGPRGNLNTATQLKEHGNEMTPHDFLAHSQSNVLLIHHQRSSLWWEMQISTEIHNGDNVQRVRDLGTLRLKWDVSIKSLLQKGRRKTVRAKGGGGPQGKKSFLTQQEQRRHELTETVAACKVSTWVLARWASALREEVDMSPVPNPEAISNCLQREN